MPGNLLENRSVLSLPKVWGGAPQGRRGCTIVSMPLFEYRYTRNVSVYPHLIRYACTFFLIFPMYDSTAPHRFAEPPELRGA